MRAAQAEHEPQNQLRRRTSTTQGRPLQGESGSPAGAWVLPIPGLASPHAVASTSGPATIRRPAAMSVLRRRVEIEDKDWGPPRKITSVQDLVGKKKLSPAQVRALDELIDKKHVTFLFASEKALLEHLGGSRDRRLMQIIDHRSPDRSPAHYERPMDVSDTVYQLSAASVPKYYDMPQSPRHDDSERETTQVSVAPALAQLSSGLQTTKKRSRTQTGIKTTKSTNIFKFSVQVDYRVTEMKYAPPNGWILGDETEHTISRQSQIYQSSGTELPAHEDDEADVKRRKVPKTEVNQRVRSAIVQANELGYQYEQFAPLSVQAFQRRKGLNDLREAQTKHKGTYRLSNTQLASSCFHSETQALGMAPVEVPPLISSLIDAIVGGLPTKGGWQVVVNSLLVHGASVPNSVCGNACKPALLQLLNQIEECFVTTYHMQKPNFRKRDVYFRRSGEYVAAMNVAGLTKFQGYGTGAKAIKKVTVPVHGVVYEFPPD